MITAQEAYDAINPDTPEPQKKEAAEKLIASSAALDAYYNSRPELEQITARANGAGQVPTHAELNGDAPATVASGDGIEQGAVGDTPAVGVALPPAGEVGGSGGAPVDATVVSDSEQTAIGTGKPDTDKDDAELQAEIEAMQQRVSALEAQKKGEA